MTSTCVNLYKYRPRKKGQASGLVLSTPNFQIFSRFDDRKSWINPYIGLRIQHQLDNYWYLVGYVDIGGSRSNLTWQALAGVNYAFSTDITGKFGYRHIYYNNCHNDGFMYDPITSELYLGLRLR